MRRPLHRSAVALLGGLSLALAVTACGNGSGNGAPEGPQGDASGVDAKAGPPEIPSVSADDDLAGMVPKAIASDGTMVIGQDQTYAPNEFINDEDTVVGMDVDLGRAVAQKLGLEAKFQNSSFDGIIPGLDAGKYEAAMSSLTINGERVKQVDMVSYYSAGTKMATLTGNPEDLTLDTLCGHPVAVQKGTTQLADLTERSKTCQQQGKSAIDIKQFQNQTDVNLALTAKRAQAMLADSPVVDYAVSQTGDQLEVVGESYDTAPYGIALPQDKGKYSTAVQQATQALIDDGTYDAILQKWSLRDGAIENSEINPSAS